MIKYAVLSFSAALLLAGNAMGQDLAPTRLGDVLLHATRTASTGGLSSTGSFTELFTSGGIDYTFAPDGSGFNANPAAYTWTKTGANTGRISEPGVTIDLTFTADMEGTFVATWGNGTQSGTFELEEVNLTPQLINISTRAFIPAQGTAIGGFYVNGPGKTRVLIRAAGPRLAGFGVANPLANPKVTVYKRATVQGEEDEQIAANDDWSADATAAVEIEAARAQVFAFTLADGSADAALVLTLDPGGYTAVVSSVDPTLTGEVLVEVYALP